MYFYFCIVYTFLLVFLTNLALAASISNLPSITNLKIANSSITTNSTNSTNSTSTLLCNGYEELCDYTYDNITYLVTHDAFAYTSNIAATQNCPPELQLDDGVRALKMEVVAADNGEDVMVCHTSCLILSSGTITQTLYPIVEWLSKNPNEVITIMWANIQNVPIANFTTDFSNSGILPYSYIQPPGQTTWPTLRELISAGTRVINFIDYGANQTQMPWIMDQFAFTFETPYYNLVDLDNTNGDYDFVCTKDRPQDPVENAMYVVNHFVYGNMTISDMTITVPRKGTASIVNSDSLRMHFNNCTSVFGYKATFIEIDFYNMGTALQIVADINNVPVNPAPLKCNNYINTPATTSSSPGKVRWLPMTSLLATLLCITLAYLATL